MELHQHILHNPLPDGLAVYLLKQTDGIDALYQRRTQPQQLFYLVGLQVADEMPAVILRAEFGHFGRQLLHAALAEKPLTCLMGLAQGLDGMELGNSDKPDPVRQ